MKKLILLLAFAFMFISMASAGRLVVPTSIVNYTFDNSSNLDQDDTGNADINYSEWGYVNGKSNGGINTNNGMANNSYNTQITEGGISFWFKPSVNTASDDIGCAFHYDDSGNTKGDFSLGIQGCNSAGSGGALTLYFNNVTNTQAISTSTTNFLAGTWYHTFIKINSTHIGIYIDGTRLAIGSGSPNQALFGSSRLFHIFSGASATLNWTIDELKFYNSEITEQQIRDIYGKELSEVKLCDTSINVLYLNFTFKDESTLSRLNASVNLFNITYFGTDFGSNKSYSFTNLTDNFEYSLCYSDYADTVYATEVIMQYSKTGYSQRTYNPSDSMTLANTSTSKQLYLVPNSLGQYVTFQVINSAEQSLEGVQINITSASLGDIESRATDSSGGATFFLNPLSTYIISASKAGYASYTTTLSPASTSYTISLSATDTASQSDYMKGMTYLVSPSLGSSLVNDTTYTFNFTIASTYWDLDGFGYRLYNSSGSQIGSASGVGSTGGTATSNINTLNSSHLTMNYYWIISGNYTNGSVSWPIYMGTGSSGISGLLSNLNNYLTNGNGIFGLRSGTFGFSLIIFTIIFFITGVINYKFGFTSPGAIIAVLFGLVALFDLGLGLMPNPIGAVEHFPTIFMSIMALGILLWEAGR